MFTFKFLRNNSNFLYNKYNQRSSYTKIDLPSTKENYCDIIPHNPSVILYRLLYSLNEADKNSDFFSKNNKDYSYMILYRTLDIISHRMHSQLLELNGRSLPSGRKSYIVMDKDKEDYLQLVIKAPSRRTRLSTSDLIITIKRDLLLGLFSKVSKHY